jgi:20S proteasome alpha/beta subunit
VAGRTDKAVLAVNGFAADGNQFVKRVKQRLEVCSLQHLSIITISYANN